MSSARKNIADPSMADIISSIKNILDDDSGESASGQVSTSDNASAPVMQLTENQIAEPERGAGAGDIPTKTSDPLVLDEAAIVPDPATPAASMNEAVGPAPENPAPAPGNAPENTVVAPAQPATGTVEQTIASPVPPLANELTAVDTAAEIPAASAQLTGSAQTAAAAPRPPETQSPAPVAPSAPDAAAVPAASAAPVANDVVSAQPAVPAQEPAGATGSAPVAAQGALPAEQGGNAPSAEQPVENMPDSDPLAVSPLDEALGEPGDPVGEMMRAADADPMPAENFGGEVATDRMLEDLPSGEVENTDSSPGAPETSSVPGQDNVTAAAVPVSETGPAPEPESEPEPVIVDATRVSPEDAAAITAVAAATSEALAGTPEETAPKEKCTSLEDSIKAMLKPMIREWLDDNMPRILEGAIREEVEETDNNNS